MSGPRSRRPRCSQGPGIPLDPGVADAVSRIARFPRLRYMGSKYKLIPELVRVFSELGGSTALDAFSGSGVVSYALKTLGYSVVSNDFLTFPSVISRATVENQAERLSPADVELICSPAADDRDFVRRTFDGLYFTSDDRAFIDSAWSHLDLLSGYRRDLAVSALILAAARKQPRGVFTVTDLRYDDGRRDLRIPLRTHFRECAADYNEVVFDSSTECSSLSREVSDLGSGRYDVVYLDPPYAPPRDDNCYIKRYHFLEGLSVYWRGVTILPETRTKKLAKRYTPFSYKSTVTEALRDTVEQFKDASIVLSYSSNAVPDLETIVELLRDIKSHVEVRELSHRYSFGTHAAAQRTSASEYLFVCP